MTKWRLAREWSGCGILGPIFTMYRSLQTWDELGGASEIVGRELRKRMLTILMYLQTWNIVGKPKMQVILCFIGALNQKPVQILQLKIQMNFPRCVWGYTLKNFYGLTPYEWRHEWGHRGERLANMETKSRGGIYVPISSSIFVKYASILLKLRHHLFHCVSFLDAFSKSQHGNNVQS